MKSKPVQQLSIHHSFSAFSYSIRSLKLLLLLSYLVLLQGNEKVNSLPISQELFGFEIDSSTQNEIPKLDLDLELKNETAHDHSHLQVGESKNYTAFERYEMMGIAGYIITAVILFFIWIVGTFGNILVMYVICKNRQLQTPMNLLLVNLSIADFIMAALGSPLAFSSAAYGRWVFGHTGCIIYGFGMALGGITSITTLMVLAFERFLMIVRPFRAADIQKQHSFLFIIVIWMYSLTLTVPPLIGWASYGPEAAYISCSVNWESDDLATTTYIVFLFVMGLLVPLAVIIFSYAGIIITVRQTGEQAAATRRAELRVVWMIAVMVVSFMIAWLPYAIVSLFVAFSDFSSTQGFVGVVPSIFAKSSSCYNPIIYVGLNTQFRSALLKLFGISQENREDGETALTVSNAAVGAIQGDKSPVNLNVYRLVQTNQAEENEEHNESEETSFIVKKKREEPNLRAEEELEPLSPHPNES